MARGCATREREERAGLRGAGEGARSTVGGNVRAAVRVERRTGGGAALSSVLLGDCEDGLLPVERFARGMKAIERNVKNLARRLRRGRHTGIRMTFCSFVRICAVTSEEGDGSRGETRDFSGGARGVGSDRSVSPV